MITELFEYESNGVICEGFFAFTDDTKTRPCVMVSHAWGGQSEVEREIAIKLAEEEGYIAFAIDIYGKGNRGDLFVGNEHLMQPFIDDRLLLRKRLLDSFEACKKHPIVDNNKIAIIGYCFGGLCSLDLARASVKGLLAAISFHGVLTSPSLPRNLINSKVLILHGYDDPMAPPKDILSISEELTECKANWEIQIYGNTMHAFTSPLANLPKAGILYNPQSAKKAWSSMKTFLKDSFE